MATSASQDEIFRADQQHTLSSKSRNFSSFHTEQGGPIAHTTSKDNGSAMRKATSASQDEIFRADKQHTLSSKSRNFSSFHTEQGGPIAHLVRAPTADMECAGLRHSHADACNYPQNQTLFLLSFFAIVVLLIRRGSGSLLSGRHGVWYLKHAVGST
jgi:hypothetical protein